MKKSANKNMNCIINAISQELGYDFPVDLRNNLEDYIQYKLDVVTHAELHAGNSMFMRMISEHTKNPYELIGTKMFLVTSKEVWFYSEDKPMKKIFSACYH